LVVFILMGTGMFGKDLRKSQPNIAALASLTPRKAIKDKPLLWKSVIVLGVVFVAFTLHGWLEIKPATVALGGAALLLLVSQLPPKKAKVDPVETLLAEIDWSTLFFFIGMFIMIAGLEVTGALDYLLVLLTSLTGTHLLLTALVIMWSAALLTMVTSAVPFVLAMIPVIGKLIAGLPAQMGYAMPEGLTNCLWWALALGACLGANGTIIGSAANMVVMGVSNRSGHKITFGMFAKKGLPATVMSLILASLYLWLRFFVLEWYPRG
jgi:Na+/H+ antiporter NhaD/arsenite permease-like protein